MVPLKGSLHKLCNVDHAKWQIECLFNSEKFLELIITPTELSRKKEANTGVSFPSICRVDLDLLAFDRLLCNTNFFFNFVPLPSRASSYLFIVGGVKGLVLFLLTQVLLTIPKFMECG